MAVTCWLWPQRPGYVIQSGKGIIAGRGSTSVVEYELNHLGQPVGLMLEEWQAPIWPQRKSMAGSYCRLEAIDPALHADALFASYQLDNEGRVWTYLPYGPFASPGEYRQWLEQTCLGDDPLFYAIVDNNSNAAIGVASYLRIVPATGSIEIGHLCYSPLLQRTTAATEAMYLMMRQVFELGYRRCEWKCNALNQASRRAAERLGFRFEGIFRQANIVKGRNRDTAWYSVIDTEWPALQPAFESWLQASNFDAKGEQLVSLSELTQLLLD
jgi:RimJ/RimL family protein N-acetyltransferase